VRTVVVSDLHLGVTAGNDVARRPEVRPRLLETVRDADRLVLLGDVFELRERSLEDILALSRPLFEELSETLGDGELVLVPGNHDHALTKPLFDSIGGVPNLRRLEHRVAPTTGDPLGSLADLFPGRFELAYPGLWLEDGVYATHGHHMDTHSPVPMVECLAIALSARFRGGPPGPGSIPAEYEPILGPVYAASRHIGRRQALGRGGAGDVSARLYERLSRASTGEAGAGEGGSGRSDGAESGSVRSDGSRPARPPERRHGHSSAELADRVLGTAVPIAVRALNRLGLGPFDPDISGRALRRAGLQAMGEVVRRLDIEAEHVVFGHTHRPGPLPNDLDEWTLPGTDGRPPTRLINSGSWIYSPLFLGTRPADSPYWPGRCVIVEDGSAPGLVHPLADAGHEQLARAS
jgi:Calcineurin-like phosphoesterase